MWLILILECYNVELIYAPSAAFYKKINKIFIVFAIFSFAILFYCIFKVTSIKHRSHNEYVPDNTI